MMKTVIVAFRPFILYVGSLRHNELKSWPFRLSVDIGQSKKKRYRHFKLRQCAFVISNGRPGNYIAFSTHIIIHASKHKYIKEILKEFD